MFLIRVIEEARLRCSPFAPSKKRARGTPGARCTRGLVCKSEKHTSVVTTVTPASSGVPRAMVFSACSACPPVGDPLLPTVVVDRAGPASSVEKALRCRAMLWREASRREHATWADARSDVGEAHLRPGRIAQRGRQPKVRSPQRFSAPRTHPLYKAHVLNAGSRPQDLMPPARRCRVHRIPPREP